MPESAGYYADGPEPLIVSLATRGDRCAFAELVRRRQSWIRNVMRRCCGDASLADDLSQQVFLKAWRNIRQLNDARHFGGWLKRLAINEWLQHCRRNDPLRDARSDVEPRLTRRDTPDIGMDLDAALAALPAEVRLCIVLSYHERLSHPEIAELTGLRIGTVKSHIRRGALRLRELLSAYDACGAREEAV